MLTETVVIPADSVTSVPSAALMLSHTGALLRAWIRIACRSCFAARQAALDPCSFLHGGSRVGIP
jgi:hypothetical protein